MKVINGYQAQTSPCYTCQGNTLESYPECCSECKDVNAYLISIGDLPHNQPKNLTPLHILYPPQKNSLSLVFCTTQQFLDLSDAVIAKKKRIKKSVRVISLKCGVTENQIRQLIDKRKKRMEISKYNKLVEWVKK